MRSQRKLLPNRHPNKDFFILDVSDATPRDEMASMEHPVYSLSLKPDTRILHYEYQKSSGQKVRLEITPSVKGLATIMDKDILLYCISKLVHQKNRGVEITANVELSAHEVMVGCNWNTGKRDYERFEAALDRLMGTIIKTNIKTGNLAMTRGFGLIDEYEMLRIDEHGEAGPFGRLSRIRVKLSDWTFRAVQSMEVLEINRDYFRLRRPLERRLYEIARKQVGNKSYACRIGFDKLYQMIGSNRPERNIRSDLREIISAGHIPDYGFMLDGDMVVMQRLVPAAELDKDRTLRPLQDDTRHKASAIARECGVSLMLLEREWNVWADKTHISIESNDAHFMAFCQNKLKAKQSKDDAQGMLALADKMPNLPLAN